MMSVLDKLRGLISTSPDQESTFEGTPLRIEAAAVTDVGRVRSGNEDSVLLVPRGRISADLPCGTLAVLADGMGGNNAGEVASALACRVVAESVAGSRSTDLGAALVEAVRVANQAVFSEAKRNPDHRGMGTTLVAFAIEHRSAYMAYVGDSRLYLVRDERLYQLSEDHSLVYEMVKRGVMTVAEAGQHPDRNVLSRALGTRERVECSRWDVPFAVSEQDVFLLCSDGLHDLVSETQLVEMLSRNHPAQAAALLIAEANRRGGHDNISAIVIAVQPLENQSDHAAPAGEAPASVPITREIVVA